MLVPDTRLTPAGPAVTFSGLIELAHEGSVWTATWACAAVGSSAAYARERTSGRLAKGFMGGSATQGPLVSRSTSRGPPLGAREPRRGDQQTAPRATTMGRRMSS